MKKVVLILLFTCIFFSNIKAEEEIITQFSSTNFTGWFYSRPGFIMSSIEIANNKVLIYKDKVDGEYYLTSPTINLVEYSALKVEFDWRSSDYNQVEYDKIKNSPTISLLNPEETELIDSKIFNIELKQLITPISVNLATNYKSSGKIKISAPNADVYNTGAIKKIKIYGELLSGVVVNLAQASNIFVNEKVVTITDARNKSIKLINLSNGNIVATISRVDSDQKEFYLSTGFYAIIVNGESTKIVVK